MDACISVDILVYVAFTSRFIFRAVALFRHCRHVPTHVFSKCPQNAAAAISICVMYRPDQPALSAQTDPADIFLLRAIDV